MLSVINNKLASNYDVLIIGGGPAGLSAGLTIGRLRRTTLICDDQHPRNKPSLHMNNFPGYDGVAPSDWIFKVHSELNKYPTIQLHTDRVIKVSKTETGFEVELEAGDIVKVQKVLLSYGIKDQLPDISGIKELWGHSVIHCPYCHGFEFQDKPLALLGDGDIAIHLLSLILGLTNDIILFTNGISKLTDEQKQKIKLQNITIIETPVKKLEHNSTKLESIILENGDSISRTALFIAPILPVTKSSNIGEELGCKNNEMGFYEIDLFCQTSVSGVYAAGDIAGFRGQSVLNSASSGSTAGARIVSELLMKKANF